MQKRKSATPVRKWVTPERQKQLALLFSTYGNKCLLGHHCCPELEHYLEAVPHLVTYPIIKDTPCVTRDGNTLRDAEGNIMYTRSYGVGHDVVYRERLNTAYEQAMDRIIHDWRREDANARAYAQALEAKRLHSLNEHGRLRGHFNSISQSIYFDNQPMFEILELGIDALTFHPFVKVRLASSIVALHIDISEALRPLSKNKKHKCIRYGRPLPSTILELVSECASRAVSKYLS
jgi:hypothetical protein